MSLLMMLFQILKIKVYSTNLMNLRNSKMIQMMLLYRKNTFKLHVPIQ